MVKIPDFQPSVHLDAGQAPQLPYRHLEVPALTNAARGQEIAARNLEGLGAGVQHLGSDVTAYYDQKAAEADQSWVAKARAQTLLDAPQQEQQLQAASVASPAMAVGGAGVMPSQAPLPLPDRTKAAWDAYSKNILAGAPSERAKRAYTDWFAGFGAEQQVKAFDTEQKRQDAQKNADFLTALDSHTRLVATDPSQFDAAWGQVEQDLRAASAWADPAKLAAIRADTRAKMELARARALATSDPLQFQREVNPQQYSVGPGQSSLSRGYVDNPYYSRVSPEQVDALSKGVSVKIRDSAISSVIAQEGVQKKEAAGKAADLDSIIRQSVHLVGGDPSQFDQAWGRVESALGDAASWADPAKLAELRDKTRENMELTRAQALPARDRLREIQSQQYDAASGTGTPSKGWAGNEYYSHLDPAQIAALSKDAQSTVVAQHNAAIAAQKAQYDQRYNDLMTSLLPGGNGGMSDVWEARKQGWLTDYTDIKKAVDAIDTRDKQSMDLAKAQALFTTGHTFNPFQTDDKKATDLVYQAAGGVDGLLGGSAGAGLAAGGDPQAAAALRLHAFVEKTGIIPQTAVDELRRGMISQDRGELTSAFTLMDGLARANPGAVDRAFGPEDMKRLDQYRVMAPLTQPDDLVKAMNPNVDPATAKARDELGTKGADILKAEVAKGTDYLPSILSHFNPGVLANTADWKSAPGAPLDPIAQQQLRDDYEAAYRNLYSLSGDEVSAKAGALTALDRKWGVTEVGSGVTVMPRPPERSFPAIGGSHDWMERQAEDQVKASYPDAQDWTPITLPETEGALGVRQTPSYGLGIHDHDGVWHVLMPPAGAKPGWPFDYEAAHAQAVQEFNDTRGSLIQSQSRPQPLNPMKTITDKLSTASPQAARAGEAMHPQSHGSVQLPPPLPQYPESAFSRSQ